MKNVKKITIIAVLLIVILLSLLMLNYNVSAQASSLSPEELATSQKYDEELISYVHTPEIDENFSEDEVIIILKREYSDISLEKNTSKSKRILDQICKFENIEIKKINDLFPLQDQEEPKLTYRKMLSLGLKTRGKEKVIEAMGYLQNIDFVLVAQPKYEYEAISEWVPSDAKYSNQWGLHGTYGINVENAWDISLGANVKVGIFEGGIDTNHEDLVGRIGQGNFTPASGTDLSHGTHVGGIISAAANDKGIAGISQATLHLLNRSNFVESLRYASNNNIRIINASFNYRVSGTDTPAPANATHMQAIENYGNSGGLLICSAGNDGNNTDNSPQYPAGYADKTKFPNINNVISVGSINSNGKRSSFSNYGVNSVDIYAPGNEIYSTLPNNNYGNMSGTSMAAPHVTGAAALLLSYAPNLTVNELKQSLLGKSDDIIIEGNSTKLLNIGSVLWGRANPNRIELRNLGHFDIGGGCNGNSSGWNIEVTNNSKSTMKVIYNTKMCNAGDAKNWTGLSDIDIFELAAGASKTVQVESNSFATHVAFSYVVGNYRYITYANELNSSRNMIKPDISTVNYNSYEKNGMQVRIVGKNGGTWLIELTNRTGSGRTFDYNSRMCFAGDAEKWSGLSHVEHVYLASGATTSVPLKITEYGTATSIAISYKVGDIRKIFYANDLSKSGTMSAYASEVDPSAPSTGECVAAGTLITLADGSQKAVEDLTGNEMLLVWNLVTGTYDYAPILVIDSDQIGHYEVINLSFSDGTTVEVISEHGFWDVDLNKYVYLDEYASEYIGHSFLKQGENGMTEVTLTDVNINTEVTTAYSPVTYGHLCYYVNGMLSMPGGLNGLFNIFEVDSETMMYDAEAMAADIEEYGLYTYEELNALVPVSEEIFDAVNGQYLKIAVGKGVITVEQIQNLVDRYGSLFE